MIKVLIVDDSILMRTLLSDIIDVPGEIMVAGTARNGLEAIEKVRELSPDVITMDVEMPKMDGISAVRAIMKEKPTPIIMVSAVTREGAHSTFLALAAGAVDFIAKPSGSISLDIDLIKNNLISKIKAACRVDIKKLPVTKPVAENDKKQQKQIGIRASKVIVIGASTGGPPALEKVISSFPAGIKAGILIVQHMPPGFTKSFAERLDRVSNIHVKEAGEGDLIEEGTALLAPGNYHMAIKKAKPGLVWREAIALNQDHPVHSVRPAADVTMNAVAEAYGPNTIGVVLTGMGCDGAFGLRNIKSSGGRTIACDEKTSIIFGMPKAAIELGCVDRVLPLESIAAHIIRSL